MNRGRLHESRAGSRVRKGGTAEIANVQALRAIAVLLVVGVHLAYPGGIEARYLDDGNHLTTSLHRLGPGGVDLFFVISGLIMTVTTWGRQGVDNARRFLLRRVTRIFPIYWVVTTLMFLAWLIEPHLVVPSDQSYAPDPLASFMLLPQKAAPFVQPAWTLTYEMYFYLVFGVALWAGGRWFLRIIGAWGLLTIALGLTVSGTTANPWLDLFSSPLSLEFLLGIGCGLLVLRHRTYAPWLCIAIGATALVATSFIPGPSPPTVWLRALGYGPSAALIVYGAIGLEWRRRVAPKWLRLLGDASYSIYLWHVLLLGAVGKSFATFLPLNFFTHAIALVAVPVGAVSVAVLLHRLVEVPLLQALHDRQSGRVHVAEPRFGVGR